MIKIEGAAVDFNHRIDSRMGGCRNSRGPPAAGWLDRVHPRIGRTRTNPYFALIVSFLHVAPRMIHTIIFDLGNVLLHFDHRIILGRLSPYLHRGAYAGARRELEVLTDAYERGEILTDHFVSRFLELLSIERPFDRNDFAALWSDIFWKNTPLLELLPGLRPGVKLMMLSNTNPMHLSFAEDRYPEVFEPFTERIYSFDAGMRKPERAIFDLAISRSGGPADGCLYFDDISAYIDAAAAAGINAFQYVSVSSVRDILATYELLAPAAVAAGAPGAPL
jgi:glucose-1-phosphatase